MQKASGFGVFLTPRLRGRFRPPEAIGFMDIALRGRRGRPKDVLCSKFYRSKLLSCFFIEEMCRFPQIEWNGHAFTQSSSALYDVRQ